MTPPDMESLSWARVALALIVVFGLIALMGLVLKTIKMRGFALPGSMTNGRRLHLIESLPLDARRRLVIVRCDDAEHLIMLGVNEDIVIAPNLAKTPAGLQTKSKFQWPHNVKG
jgi:flagellar protein FliO/FliZ